MSRAAGEVSIANVALATTGRRRKWLARAGWIALVLAFASVFPGQRLLSGAANLFLPLALTGGLSFLVRTLGRSPPRDQGEGALRWSADELAVRFGVDRELRLARRDLAQGYLVEPRRVVLSFVTGDDVMLDCVDGDAARALLEDLGVSAAASVLSVPLVSPADRGSSGMRIFALLFLLLGTVTALGTSIAFLSSLAYFIGHGGARDARSCVFSAGISAALWAGIYFTLRFLSPQSVVVGADGVSIERWGRPRFVRFADIERVERTLHGLALVLVGGGSVSLRVSFDALEPASTDEARTRREVLHRRIAEARALAGKSGVAAAKLASLDRRERSIEAWRAALRALPSQESDYRSQRIEPDELARVVEDALAEPERRIGAAIALGASGDVALEGRVRVAIDACVDPDMKRALEEAALGELDEATLRRATRRT